MTDQEAFEICERWWAHLESQKQKTEILQRAASMARNGQQREARAIMRNVDRQPKVFDGATLLPAVRHLYERVRQL